MDIDPSLDASSSIAGFAHSPPGPASVTKRSRAESTAGRVSPPAALDLESKEVVKPQIPVVKAATTAFVDVTVIGVWAAFSYVLASNVRQVFGIAPDPNALISATFRTYMVVGLPIALFLLLSLSMGHYTRYKPLLVQLKQIFKSVFYIAACSAVVLFSMKEESSRLWTWVFWIGLLLFLPLGRLFTQKLLIRTGHWFRPTLIVGSGRNGADMEVLFSQNPSLGYRVVERIGFDIFATLVSLKKKGELPPPYHDVSTVIALDSSQGYTRHKALIDRWISTTRELTFASPLKGLPLNSAEMVNVFRSDSVMLNLRNNMLSPFARGLKRVFDIVLSFVLLLLLTPVLFTISCLVMLDGGPALFAHKRIGRGGNKFSCLKFRTMVQDADGVLEKYLRENPAARREWAQDQKIKHDPRITRIGRILRSCSLDELPQLLNVISGDMSLVGPRPIVDAEVEKYRTDYEFYCAVRPGITGLWQVSGRNDISYDERVYLDSWYVRNWSVWNDIVILILTVPTVLFRSGAY